MTDFTPEQARIVARIDRALKDAERAGLVMRVFDGAVLLCRVEALDDPRYGEFGPPMTEWESERTERVGGRIDADGGAGK
ncbi:hypothetical protein R3Q56_006715 [Pseudomonas aeruginosa]|jgi:hypothetical protein|nr:hypothetical protein [Pseudomonas aeruginosa]ELR2942343.1 hypothetical protein [Pseudomonas aeruginosa]